MGFIQKLFDFIAHPTHLRTAILVIFITVVIIPLTVLVSQQQQVIRQRAAEPQSVPSSECSPPYDGYLGCLTENGCDNVGVSSHVSCSDENVQQGVYCYESTKQGQTCSVNETSGACDDRGNCIVSAISPTTAPSCASDSDCVDGNACTQDACVAGSCQFNPVAIDTVCDHNSTTYEADGWCNAQGVCSASLTNQPSPTNAPTVVPTLTPTTNEDLGILKSNFFKNDETANSIFEGNTYELKIEKLFASPKDDLVNTLSFEYKIGSAVRQLGYPPFRYTIRRVEDIYKYDFYGLYLLQRKHGHAENNFITKEIIILLDDELYEKEKKDIELAKQYSPSTLFLEAPKNAPPKEHLAALFVGFLSVLPDELSEKPWTVEKFPFSGLVGISFGLLIDSKGTKFLTPIEAAKLGDFRYCEPMYYPELGNCFSHNPVISTTWFAQSDMSYMRTIIHEYGHAIGEKIKVLGNDGTITNVDKQFSKISFGFENGEPLILLRPDAKHEEFISGYAKTNGYEDFADSFLAYVMAGKIFRERAKETVYLQQKYDFLRDKVLAGYEYNTGDLEFFKTLIAKFPESIGNHPDSFVPDGHVWDYKYATNIVTTVPKSVAAPHCYLKDKGDADCDNKITQDDEKIWEQEFISELKRISTQKRSDFNSDGIINIVDFNIWKTNFQDPSLPH